MKSGAPVRFVCVALLAGQAFAAAATNSITINASSAQPGRPFTLSRVFKQGEIPAFPRPSIEGFGTPAQWQADVLNRYPDGSAKHALISFIHDLPEGRTVVAFETSGDACHLGDAGTCTNAGLPIEQVLAFNESSPGAGDGWDFSIEAAAAGTVKEARARRMLGAGNWRKWISGPVADVILVEDRSTGLSWDFGWLWNGTSMIDCESGGDGCVLSAESYRSLHPIFVLTFYRGWRGVKGEYILENSWTNKRQDQLIALTLRSGGTLSDVRFSSGAVTPTQIMSARTNGNQALTSVVTELPHGLQTGQVISIRGARGSTSLNGNWPVTVKDPYEFTVPEKLNGTYTPGSATAGPFLQVSATRWRKTYWSGAEPAAVSIDYNFAYLIESKVLPHYDLSRTVSRRVLQNTRLSFNATDRGEIGGAAGLPRAFTGGEEGGIVQTSEIQYLYTFDPTAEAAFFGTEISGGGGRAAVSAHYPIHYREDSIGLFRDADEDDSPDTDEAFGRVLSVDFRPRARTLNGSGLPRAVGTVSTGGWSLDASHHHDRNFIAYLLTGDWFFLEELYYFAAWNISYGNPDPHIASYRHANWGLVPSSSTRDIAWGLRQLGHATFFAPDTNPGTGDPNAEREYLHQKMRFNIAVREGNYNIRASDSFRDGSTCSISEDGLLCPGYNAYAERSKWVWGRMTQGEGLLNPLAFVRSGIPGAAGSCCVQGEMAGLWDAPWHEYFVHVSLGHLDELGFPVRSLREKLAANLIERILHPLYNPYLIDLYEAPVGVRPGVLFTDWAAARNAVRPEHRDRGTWRWSAGPESYLFRARAALSFMTGFNGGGFSGQAAWDWLESVLKPSDLKDMDENPKNAIIPRPTVP